MIILNCKVCGKKTNHITIIEKTHTKHKCEICGNLTKRENGNY